MATQRATPPKKAPPKRPAAKKSVDRKVDTAHLSPFEQRFCEEYLVDLNGTRAYLRVKPGATETTASSEGSRFLAKPKVQVEIARLRELQSERTGITADAVLMETWNQFRADPRELMELRVGCCRHCWGDGYRHQYTDAEFQDAKALNERARREATTSGKSTRVGPFDPKGGPGFNRARSPNTTCPHCGGEGISRAVLKDTRTLSPAAAALYAGVKETKEGLELKTTSRDAAADRLFRHFGLYRDKLEVTLPTVAVRDFTGRGGG